jgi:PAS domain S-box-containing protein
MPRRQVGHLMTAPSDAKQTRAFYRAPIGIGLVLDGCLHDANQRFCRLVGYSRDELVGQRERILYQSDRDHRDAKGGLDRHIAKHDGAAVETLVA